MGYLKSMGYYLKSQMGIKYQIIGFSFPRGSFMAIGLDPEFGYTELEQHTIDAEPLQNSLNYYFSQTKYDNFILRIKDIPSNSVFGEWISEPQQMLSIGALYNGDPSRYYSDVTLNTGYDAIIHYDSTTAAVQLDAETGK